MPDALPRVAVLASGAGSTLRALIEAQHGGQLPVQFVGLFSDKPAAPALEHALRAGIPVCALSPKGYANRAAHDAALFARVADAQPDLVVCAGYMRIIEAASTRRFAGRMINLHPSLLPKHRGLHTHRAALDAGDLSHGASVHLVTAELDDGSRQNWMTARSLPKCMSVFEPRMIRLRWRRACAASSGAC